MQRLHLPVRPDWQQQADTFGFKFHTIHGEPYWDESVAYQFSMAEIEQDLEDPTAELHSMCLEAVTEIAASEYWLQRFALPEFAWDLVREYWQNVPILMISARLLTAPIPIWTMR